MRPCVVCARIYRSRVKKRGPLPESVYFEDRGVGGLLCRAHARAPAENLRSAYGQRVKALRELGFSRYDAYLRSPLWRAIRSQVLAAANGRCSFCEGRANQVHHRKYTYAVLAGEDRQHLFAVCGGCHKYGEFSRWGDKVTPGWATSRMKRRGKMLRRARRRREEADEIGMALHAELDAEFAARLAREA
jgi:hypothetical protein